MNSIQETLEFIVKGIVSDSSSVSITSTQNGDLITLTVTTKSEIAGQIIGKQGKIIKAIRTILALTYPHQKFLLEFKDQTDFPAQTS